MAATLLITVALAGLSVLRFDGYNAGMHDIGNMSQAIWSATRGRPLEFTYVGGNLSRLALHIEAIYFALAPLYALWSDPRLLLVAQAVLFGLGAFPVHRLAARRLDDRRLARIPVLIYLLYPTANTAVLFDFHGDTLALPLIMFALEAMDRRAWRSYALWIASALLCKFYVAVAVTTLGVVLWMKGQRRVGALTAALALGWLGVALLVIRPAFVPPDRSALLAGSLFDYARFYFGGMLSVDFIASIPQRLATVFIVLTPALIFGRFAWPWLLPGLAIALPAFVSIGEVAAFDYRFHHYAIPVPFFVLALVYGVDEVRCRQRGDSLGKRVPRRPWRNDLWFSFALSVLFYVLLVDAPLNPRFWFNVPNWGIHHTKYGQLARDRVKDEWLAVSVPEGAPLAANGLLAPHMVNRSTLYLTRYTGYADEQSALFLEHLDGVEFVVTDALFDFAVQVREGVVAGGVSADVPAISDVLTHPDFGLARSRDGLLLFERDAAPRDRLEQHVDVVPYAEAPDVTVVFGDHLGLVGAEALPLGGGRYRLSFAWIVLQPVDEMSPLLPVSRLVGFDHYRYPHLPIIALHPTPQWQAGEMVRETFDIALPEALSPGDYPLVTGWYDSSHLEAAMTEARSRVGEEAVTLVLHVAPER